MTDDLLRALDAAVGRAREHRAANLLDTYQCPGCLDDHTETARCDHTDTHCPDCADEGFCRLCVRERGDDS